MSSNKIDAFDLPMVGKFTVTLKNIFWMPISRRFGEQAAGDEWATMRTSCVIGVEVDRDSSMSEIILAAKVKVEKKFGTPVLTADYTIEDDADPEDTLEYSGEVY